MIFAIFGLSISSAWGNGHATLLRGLFRSLHGLGHHVHFFEKDVPYYAAHRDLDSLPYAELHLYRDWSDIAELARSAVAKADVAMVTSYCPDGRAACRLIEDRPAITSVFYDMDTPVTLERLARGEDINYLPQQGLKDFDLVLSYTGGKTLKQLETVLGARRVAPLYGWVDPELHFPQPAAEEFKADLAYLGTYAGDRHAALESLLIEPARQLPGKQFLIAGAMYPDRQNWPGNIRHFEHIAPPDHSAFYCSSPLMLSVTRKSMAENGYCPSGRLFESAACGTAVLSDWWEGLDTFFTPGPEILIAGETADVLALLARDRGELEKIGARARERTLDCHTAQSRAKLLVELIKGKNEGVKNSEENLVVQR